MEQQPWWVRVRRSPLYWLAVLGVVWATLACGASDTVDGSGGGGVAATSGDTSEPSPDGRALFAIRNRSSRPICYVQASPTSQRTWGGDRLGQNEVIAPGKARIWVIEPGLWDFRALDCNRNVLGERRNVPIQQGRIITWTFEG